MIFLGKQQQTAWTVGYTHDTSSDYISCHKHDKCDQPVPTSLGFKLLVNTVGPVLKDHPIVHKISQISQDRSHGLWWQIHLHWTVGPSTKNMWSFKRGGLSLQWSLKIGFTVHVHCYFVSPVLAAYMYFLAFFPPWLDHIQCTSRPILAATATLVQANWLQQPLLTTLITTTTLQLLHDYNYNTV